MSVRDLEGEEESEEGGSEVELLDAAIVDDDACSIRCCNPVNIFRFELRNVSISSSTFERSFNNVSIRKFN